MKLLPFSIAKVIVLPCWQAYAKLKKFYKPQSRRFFWDIYQLIKSNYKYIPSGYKCLGVAVIGFGKLDKSAKSKMLKAANTIVENLRKSGIFERYTLLTRVYSIGKWNYKGLVKAVFDAADMYQTLSQFTGVAQTVIAAIPAIGQSAAGITEALKWIGTVAWGLRSFVGTRSCCGFFRLQGEAGTYRSEASNSSSSSKETEGETLLAIFPCHSSDSVIIIDEEVAWMH